MFNLRRPTSGRGWQWFRPLDTRNLFRVPVVYAIYGEDGPIYVGQTNNLRKRFSWYRQCRYRVAKACVVESEAERDALERRLIRRLRPVNNICHAGRYRPQQRASSPIRGW